MNQFLETLSTLANRFAPESSGRKRMTEIRFLREAADLPKQVVADRALVSHIPKRKRSARLRSLQLPFEALADEYFTSLSYRLKRMNWIAVALTVILTVVFGVIGIDGWNHLTFVFALGLLILIEIFAVAPLAEYMVERARQRYAQAIRQRPADVVDAQIRRTDPAAQAHREAFAHTRASLQVWQEQHPAPLAQPFGVSPAGAEAWVCAWMTHMGAVGAYTTQFSGDGGIDVASKLYIAQVKHYTAKSVPIQDIRAHIGVAGVDPLKRMPLFFTSSTYPVSAIETADKAKMALFTYNVATGTVAPNNQAARLYMQASFEPEWWPKTEATPTNNS